MASDDSESLLPPDLPSIPNDWRWAPLQDFVSRDRGICYGIVQPGSYTDVGVPILRVENVENGRVIVDTPLHVSEEIESKFSRSRLRGGELLITLVGAYFGKVAIAPKRVAGFNVARAVGVVPVDGDAKFLSLALRSPIGQRFMQTWATTTAQPTLNLGDVARLPIPVPTPKEQRVIANILGVLDEKIELSRRMNETLEGLARAIFQSWFVDFDPVRAQRDGLPPPATASAH